MTREELEQQYIKRNGNTFTPLYTVEEVRLKNGDVDFNYTVTTTAEQVYQEWLEQKDKPQESTYKTEIRKLQDENKKLWDTVEYLLKQVDTGIPE